MTLADVAIRRPVFTTMMAIGLMVLGIVSFRNLGVDLFPDVNFPIVAVTTVYPGAGPEEVEKLVSRPLEDAVASVNGLDRIKSFSREGVSTLIIQFKLETDVKLAAVDVREKVAGARARLPIDIQDPVINRFDPGAAPILLYSLSGPLPPWELRTLAEDVLKKSLESVDGVGAVNVNGGLEREVQVNLSLPKLQALGLTPQAISQILASENLDVPSGRFTTGQEEVAIRAKGQFRTVEEIGQIILPVMGGAPVKLMDVAEIVDGYKEQRLRTRLNQEAAVSLEVVKASGTNTLAITEGVRKQMKKLEARLPAGVKTTEIFASSIFIEENTHEVNIAIVFGGAMAILIIFLFMLDWRSTLISALALPTSVITTFFAMYLLGFTLNMMSLLALSLAIGLLIDDAVVVRENIFRHMEMGEDPMTAASKGTSEIALAVMATTFTIVAVFVPVAFTGGMIGQFFREFGLTVAAAVMVSLFIAFTVDPMLSARLVKPIEHDQREKDLAHPIKGPILRTLDGLDSSYRGILAWSLRHRVAVFALAAVLFFGSLGLLRFMGMEFFPKPDRGMFMVNLEMPAGISIQAMDDAVKEAEGLISQNGSVKSLYTNVGLGGDPTRASIRVLAGDKNQREMGQVEIMEDIRKRLSAIPDMKVLMTEVGFMEGMVEAPIMLSVRGDNMETLLAVSGQVMDIVKKTPGTTDVSYSYIPGKPEYQIQIDRDKAGALGVNMASLGLGLRAAIEGDTTSKLRLGEKEIDIRVRLRPEDRDARALLETYTFTSRTGRPVLLREIADVVPGSGPAVIEREGRQRQITISGNLVGRSLGEIVNDINKALADLQLPEGYITVWSGEAERMKDSSSSLGTAMLLGVVFIYLVLASQFESFIHPFTIMFSLPLAVVGALSSLFLTGYPMGMSTFIGVILLMGLVTKNAILLVDYTNQLREEKGLPMMEALLAAGPTRLRPILMTSAAMVLGMLPTAISTGSGSEFRAPMAIAVIGGVITSTILTLVVVPVVYTWMDRFTLRGRRDRQLARQAATSNVTPLRKVA